MERVFVFDSVIDSVSEDQPQGKKMLENSIGNSGRRSLADISNAPRKPSIMANENKSRPTSSTAKEYIQQLQKENASLKKLLADKNRVIDLSKAEAQKLGITLQKMQQQNLHLAQANSQLLAEINSSKDKLKDLQHQLGCKNGLLLAINLELEGKREANTCETNEFEVKASEHKEMDICTVAEREKDEHCNTSKRQKSKSVCPSVRKTENGVGEKQRLRARRQSVQFKHDEPKRADDLSHKNDVSEKMQDYDDMTVRVKKEDVDDSSLPSTASEGNRVSIARPSRQAAKKVQSYKEIGLKTKMRRS